MAEQNDVAESIKVERSPLCSDTKVGNNGDILATFRTSSGWMIDEKALQRCNGLSGNAEELLG